MVISSVLVKIQSEPMLTPISFANVGLASIVKLLIESDADTNTLDVYLSTPLQDASKTGKNVDSSLNFEMILSDIIPFQDTRMSFVYSKLSNNSRQQ